MSQRKLAETKAHLRRLGVADAIVDSVTLAEIEELESDTKVPAVCHKCHAEHSIGLKQVAKYKLTRDSQGRVMTKCGGCYL